MRLRFGGSDPVGGPVTVEFQVVQGQVRCWAGDAVVLLDREALACWLSAPHSPLSREGVTFEPAQWGVVFSFTGRVQRTVITPSDVAQLTDLVCPQLHDPPHTPEASGADDAVVVRGVAQ